MKMIGNREYCDVKEFAQQSGRSVKAVVKDLKKMIKKRTGFGKVILMSRKHVL